MSVLPLRRCICRNLLISKQFYNVKNFPSSASVFSLPVNNYNFAQSGVLLFQPRYIAQNYSTNEQKPDTENKDEDIEAKAGLFKRFKQMYRDYWYVLVPVHLVTSAGWFGGFYYMAKSGVDVAALLQSMGLSESLTNPLKDSSMGYLAISYALYKIATPLRYTVTVGGTTISINYLKKWGYIKPVPSKEKIKELYMEKREHFRETIQETKQELIQRKDQLKERKDNIMGDYVNFKKELKDIKAK